MNNLETTDRLITEFMGDSRVKNYSKSWDALIPVIKKIREIVNTELNIDEYFDNVGLSQRLNPYDYDIESVYNGVVEFIKKYNYHINENE